MILDTDISTCSNCRYWTPYEQNSGLCDTELFIRYGPPDEIRPGMWTNCGENSICTDSDFVCLMWISKEE